MRLRFTIRDLLWLTLVVAVLTAWWLDRQQLMEWRQSPYRAFINNPPSDDDGQPTRPRNWQDWQQSLHK